jgi:hypothetical protein
VIGIGSGAHIAAIFEEILAASEVAEETMRDLRRQMHIR